MSSNFFDWYISIECLFWWFLNSNTCALLITPMNWRNSQMFFKIAVLKNLLKGLQLYWKETPTQVFSCEYCKIFKNVFFFIEHLDGYFCLVEQCKTCFNTILTLFVNVTDCPFVHRFALLICCPFSDHFIWIKAWSVCLSIYLSI